MLIEKKAVKYRFSVLMSQVAPVMLGKKRRGILFQFPFGDPAVLAGPADPFVPKPPCRSGIPGIVDAEGFAAVCRDLRIFAVSFHTADPVQDSVPGRPKLDLVK